MQNNNQNFHVEEEEVVSPVVVKVGNFERFKINRHYEWMDSDSKDEILEERKQDLELKNLALVRTPALDEVMKINHPDLFRVMSPNTIAHWILRQQVYEGYNAQLSRDEYHYELIEELQPMLAHFTELKRIRNRRQRWIQYKQHANRILEELEFCTYLSAFDLPRVRYLSTEHLVSALEAVPTPVSVAAKLLSRVRFGYSALNHVVYSLLLELNRQIWHPTHKTRFFRNGKEIKKKVRKEHTQSIDEYYRQPNPYEVQAEAGVGQQDTLTQEENTTFTDQRETTTENAYITTQTQPNLQQVSMPESEWHVRNIMAKPIPFWSGDWSVTDTLGKEIKSWKIPGDTLLGPHYNLVSTFTFFRGHPKIRFQVNGTKFHSGRLIAAFIPMYSSEESVLYSVSNLVALPHVILDASIANSGVIDLPFVHMNTYFNTAAAERSWQSLGTLFLMVFNKLRATDTSSQTIGVTAWISYENCELHQPCFAHVPALPKSTKRSQEDKRREVEQLFQSYLAARDEMQIKAESAIEGLVKSVAPLITDMVAPEMSTAVGSVLGGSSNQDKPTDPVEISRWVPNGVTSLSKGDGLDKSERLCLVNGSYTVPDADLISTTQDDMNMLELCKIPCRFELFDWKSTQGTGTRLSHFPVCPNLFSGYATSTAVDPNVEIITPTMLAYNCRGGKFWRGSLRYKVQLVASQMHTGRLMVAYGAGINLPNSQKFNEASYLNTYIIDLQEKHEVEFTVPFLCERPWLRCDRFRKYDETGMAEIEQVNFENLGYIDIYVLNRLSRPDSVSSDIAVNIFISAGDDFELAFPSEFNNCQGIGNVVGGNFIYAESLITEDTVTTRTDVGPITLGKGPGYIRSAGRTTMGENMMDLKTLLRRYTKVYSNNRINTGDGCNYISFVNTPCLSGVNKCFGDYGVQCRTHLCHYSEEFCFWRGTLRYKLIYQQAVTQDSDTPIVKNCTLKVFHVPGVFAKGNFSPQKMTADERAMFSAFESQGVQVGVTNVQGSLEFEVPFYTPYTQLKTITGDLPNSRTATGRVFIVIDSPSYNSGVFLSLELYQAAGDDFSLNYLRSVPRIQFINAFETTRDLSDNAPFINSAIPPICSGMKKMSLGKIEEEEKITAEAWQDHIPGVRAINQMSERISESTIKVETVCDTANHILQQAGKKLGLGIGDDEDEEERTTTLLEDASSMCSPLIPVIEATLQYIKQLPNTIVEYLRPDISVAEVLEHVSNLVSGFNSYMNAPGIFVKICSIVTIVSTLLKGLQVTMKNSIYHLATHVYEVINGTKQGNQVPNAEALGFDIVAPLTASLAVGVGMVGMKKIPTDKETMDMCKNISEKLKLFNFSSTAMTNVKQLWTQIKELVEWCIDYVMKLLAPELLAQLKLHRNFEKIEEWTQFIDSLENVAYADRIHYDGEFKNKIYRAIDEGKMYNTLLLEGKCGRAASVIREYVRKITEIGLHCERSKNELPYRIDPFCIFMTGTTNIGKSGCITNIGFDIMDELGYPRHNRWCAVNCTEKFFSENYRQQCAVYFDDFSTFTSEEQYQKFFNLKANTAFPLDMAFRKGEYFNSDFIFATTNTPYPEPNFVTNKMALLRRRDLLIEADWADTPEIQEALARRENMRRYRTLDNSHLKFRFLDPSDERAVPGAWMTYNEMITECITEAREHLEIQRRKLTNDLTRAGYIVPQAEAGEVRRICVEAAKNSPSLQLFDPEMWQYVVWDSEAKSFGVEAAEWQVAWEDFVHYMEDILMIDWQQLLKNNSYVVRPKATLMTKISVGLSDFKQFLKNCYTKIEEEHPWIATVGKWAIYIAGALSTLTALYYGVKKVAHRCMCAALTHYGFRCGLCGRWPKLENVRENLKPFILDQWSKLYGNLPYKDSHVTSLQEEAALLSVQRQVEVILEKAQLGTTANAEGIYSDVTKGMKAVKISAQGTYSQDVKGAAKVKVTAQNSPYTQDTPGQTTTRISAQCGNIETLIDTRVFPYMYRLRTHGKVGIPSMTISGYAIGDRWVMTNNHFFYGLEDGDLFDIYHNGAWLTVEFDKERQRIIPKKDLCIYDMPVQFHAHKSNVHHFISEKDLPHFQAGKGSLCKLNSQMRATQVDELAVKALKEIRFEMQVAGKAVPLYAQKGWSYNKCSSMGDCGSPLIGYSNHLSGNILGIHVGSDVHHSYAQLVTREMLEPLVKRKEGTPAPAAEAKLGNIIPQGHLGRIGKAPSGKAFFQSGKTDIIETEIHGMISTPVTQPSVLSPNDPRLTKKVSPLKNGIEKYSHVAPPFPKKHRMIVNEMMKDEVRLFTRAREPQVLSLSEACQGLPIDGYERLPMNTSPGYPWVLTRPAGAIGKAYLFDEEGIPLFDLRQSFEFRHEKAKKCERVESVWIDCLKDERRAIEKIQKGSTRVFTIPPVEYSILMRMYTLDFSVAVRDSRAYMDCKVGIDPQSLEWTTLYYWLAEFSQYAVAGDFSRFDGSMPADIIFDVKEDIDTYYELFGKCTEEDRNVRTILFDELVHTVHLAKDEYYMTHIGNKSGNPITVILNSRVNKRYIALAWLGIAEHLGKMEYYSMAKFQDNVRMAIYGDDNIIMIKEEVLEWFNQETIAKYLEEFGIIYTNESKTGITKFKSLDEVSFLKQTFRDHESLSMIKVPHMAQQTILELLNWTRIAPDQDELLFSNCNDALRFSYFLGEKYYNQLREKIITALHSKGKKWLPKTYMDFHLWFLNTIGALQSKKGAEGEILDIAHTDTSTFKRVVMALTVGPLMKMLVHPVKDDGRLRNERLAIVIPSGEGKTWLATTYPHLFVDHDDITLPHLEESFSDLSKVAKLAAVGNALLNTQQYDTPKEDKRILLTHHPNATNRTILRQYKLKYPNFNRNNFFNRLILDSPIETSREERNREILKLAEEHVEEFYDAQE